MRIASVAAAVVLCAVMASGCYVGTGESDVFTIYADGGGECWEDEDCPRVECHRAPSCLSGRCRVLAQPKPTLCSFGVCTEDSVCVACATDADCEAVNDAECYSLECLDSGKCYGKIRPVGDRCTHGNGTCDISATCVP